MLKEIFYEGTVSSNCLPTQILFSVSAFLVIVVNKSESAGPGMQCYIGNCTTFEDCRRPELISDCPNDKLYDACISIVVQKGNHHTIKTLQKFEIEN